MHNNMKLKIQESTYIFAVLLLFLVPFRWVIAWLIAVAVHEFFHYAAVRVLGGHVHELTINMGGITMYADSLTDRKRVISILCGPVFGFFPVLFGREFPELAICCWVLSIYNLLPLPSLDGGNVLCILIKNSKIVSWVDRFILFLLMVAGIVCAFCLHLGALPMVIVAALCVRNRKKPCKDSFCKVQ